MPRERQRVDSLDWSQVREAWQRDGFVRLGPVLSRKQAAALGDDLSTAATRISEAASPYGVLVHNVSDDTPACRTLIETGRLDRVARNVLELDQVLLFQDLLIWKQPSNATDLAWHQDYAYWPLAPTTGGMLWIALDDTTIHNGCMHYVPGSHQWGERRPTPFSEDMPVSEALARLAPLDLALAQRSCVPVPVAAGEAIMHHPLVWHMSPANTTNAARRAWATSWIASDARWKTEHANHPYNYTLRPTSGTRVAGEQFPPYGVSAT